MCVMYIQSTKQNNISFKQSAVFNTIANIESNILLNKGITDIGGFVIPQALMANNKDESIERVFKSVLYFMFTFVSPFLMLPLVNKFALKSNKILSSFGCEQKKILEVSKKYLTGDADRLVDGIKTTSKNLFGNENKFDKILEQFSDKEILRKKLINAHTEILFTDFLATNLLVASIPWLGNALTKFRTKRSGYSGTYRIADEEFTKKAAEKHDRTKKLRQAATLALAILPAATVPFVLRKSMLKGFETGNKFFKFFSKHAAAFDYKNSIFMSRATALIMWITSDYFPYQLACRDKYEYRDTVIRGSSIGLVFWGGDLVLKKAFSKLSDKIFKTNLMNKKEKRPYRLSELKNAKYQDELKSLPKNVLKRTQKAAASLYVLNLLTVMTVLGFALPAGLNKLLRTKVDEDKMKTLKSCYNSRPPRDSKIFDSFKLARAAQSIDNN